MTAPDSTFILDRNSPSVPVEFARLILLMAGERGYQREVILDGLNIPTTLIDEEVRVCLLTNMKASYCA